MNKLIAFNYISICLTIFALSIQFLALVERIINAIYPIQFFLSIH